MPNRIGSGQVNWQPHRMADTGPAKFELAGRMNLKVKEASDVVALPNGKFVIVGDMSDALHIADGNKIIDKLHLPDLKNGKSQMEGVAYDPVRHHLFVSREESAQLLRYEWNPEKSDKPKLEKTFDLPDQGPKNKGIEGLCYMPAETSPTGLPQLLLVKEGRPRELLIRDDGGGGKDLPVVLEPQVRSVCADFSAVALDPRTGNLFITSDESSTVAQVKLVRDGDKLRGKLVQAIPLRDKNDKPLARVEGATFDAKGNLFVLTENEGALYQMNRK